MTTDGAPSATKQKRKRADRSKPASEKEAAPAVDATAKESTGPSVADAPRPAVRRREVAVDAGIPTSVIAGGLLILIAVFAFGWLEFGAPIVVLILAALALVGVIAAFWSSVRTLIGETRLTGADAFAIGAPRAEEEQKRAVLRALKDLEFERAVGKISDEDYAVLVHRYREDAKRLLRILDEASAEQRRRAEAIVNARLERAGFATGPSGPAFEPKPTEEATPAEAEPTEAAPAEAAPAEAPPAEAPAAEATPAEAPAASSETETETEPSAEKRDDV
ncbi:MAG: hypothetical protein HOW73_50720 [Polyangiaceae bacterium]|nr:hypothetical protein [Polyangiaceae bacterium]